MTRDKDGSDRGVGHVTRDQVPRVHDGGRVLQQHGLAPGLALGGEHGPVARVLGQVDPGTLEHRVH